MSDLFDIRGRSALITGGSRGIGRMIAEGFASRGARVYIAARKGDECRAAGEEISRHTGGTCVPLPADLSSIDGIDQLVADYRSHEGSLDILVNNAGVAFNAPLVEFPEHGWDDVMDVNVKAPFFLTRALHRDLVAASTEHDRLAKVINIASIDGISLNKMETYSYHASKSALIQLTRLMALRLIGDGIAVSAIAPGAFPSDLNTMARDESERLAARIPAGRIGTGDDMVAAAVYLAATSGDYVVGSTITVDGGMTHRR